MFLIFQVQNQSPSVEDGEAASVHARKKESVDMFEKEEGEFPKENGEPKSNGIGGERRDPKNSDAQPDVVDDHLIKSRFAFNFSHLSLVL